MCISKSNREAAPSARNRLRLQDAKGGNKEQRDIEPYLVPSIGFFHKIQKQKQNRNSRTDNEEKKKT